MSIVIEAQEWKRFASKESVMAFDQKEYLTFKVKNKLFTPQFRILQAMETSRFSYVKGKFLNQRVKISRYFPSKRQHAVFCKSSFHLANIPQTSYTMFFTIRIYVYTIKYVFMLGMQHIYRRLIFRHQNQSNISLNMHLTDIYCFSIYPKSNL